MVQIDWRQPPAANARRNYANVSAALEELRANPGRWGVVGQYKTPQSAAVAGTRWRRLARESVERLGENGTFEFVSRPAAEGEGGEVFGRYTAAAQVPTLSSTAVEAQV